MKYCGECGTSEDEVDFVEKWRGQHKCSACLDQDPDYWQSKYHKMTNTAEYYVEQLEKTNCLLDNLSKALDKYEVVFSGQYPDEYVSALEIKEKAEETLRKNALDKLTRMSEEYGFYSLEHPTFHEKK
jgi:hypothetical protein